MLSKIKMSLNIKETFCLQPSLDLKHVSINATIAQMTRVHRRCSTDVINEEIAAALHLDIDGPVTTV